MTDLHTYYRNEQDFFHELQNQPPKKKNAQSDDTTTQEIQKQWQQYATIMK